MRNMRRVVHNWRPSTPIHCSHYPRQHAHSATFPSVEHRWCAVSGTSDSASWHFPLAQNFTAYFESNNCDREWEFRARNGFRSYCWHRWKRSARVTDTKKSKVPFSKVSCSRDQFWNRRRQRLNRVSSNRASQRKIFFKLFYFSQKKALKRF